MKEFYEIWYFYLYIPRISLIQIVQSEVLLEEYTGIHKCKSV